MCPATATIVLNNSHTERMCVKCYNKATIIHIHTTALICPFNEICSKYGYLVISNSINIVPYLMISNLKVTFGSK